MLSRIMKFAAVMNKIADDGGVIPKDPKEL